MTTAEKLAIAMTALDLIADPRHPGHMMMCDCEHDTKDCCANHQDDTFCPQCIAGVALRDIQA
jgi:hypothetical protein